MIICYAAAGSPPIRFDLGYSAAIITKFITATEKQEAWIQAQLASGHYASDSEIIREAIREKQTPSVEIDRIRAAVEAELLRDGGGT